MTAKKAASSRQHQPPLKRTQLGVQIRFTTGQRPSAPKSQPAARAITPATTSHRTFVDEERSLRRTPPASRPKIIVASVGMKLSAAEPPPFARNGFSRGKRLRNQVSKAHARFAFFVQCAANPLKPCAWSHAALTPTRAKSKSFPGSGNRAKAIEYPIRRTAKAIHWVRTEERPSKKRMK